MRSGAAWLLSLPLAGAGWLAAHELAYRLVAPADGHAAHLERAAHGYLRVAPLLLAFALSVLLAALAALAGALRGRSRSRPPALVFGLLPPLGFLVQEALERLLVGEPVAALALEPVFLAGLLLQLPFALATFALARVLLTVAHELGLRLSAAARRRGRTREVAHFQPVAPDLASVSALARGHAQRGPPPLLVAR